MESSVPPDGAGWRIIETSDAVIFWVLLKPHLHWPVIVTICLFGAMFLAARSSILGVIGVGQDLSWLLYELRSPNYLDVPRGRGMVFSVRGAFKELTGIWLLSRDFLPIGGTLGRYVN